MDTLTDWLDAIEGEEEFDVGHVLDECEMHEFLSNLEVEFRSHHADEMADE
jgi:hypothetical protein